MSKRTLLLVIIVCACAAVAQSQDTAIDRTRTAAQVDAARAKLVTEIARRQNYTPDDTQLAELNRNAMTEAKRKIAIADKLLGRLRLDVELSPDEQKYVAAQLSELGSLPAAETQASGKKSQKVPAAKKAAAKSNIEAAGAPAIESAPKAPAQPEAAQPGEPVPAKKAAAEAATPAAEGGGTQAGAGTPDDSKAALNVSTLLLSPDEAQQVKINGLQLKSRKVFALDPSGKATELATTQKPTGVFVTIPAALIQPGTINLAVANDAAGAATGRKFSLTVIDPAKAQFAPFRQQAQITRAAFALDISKGDDFTGGCSNKPFTHAEGAWTAVIMLQATPPEGLQRTGSTFQFQDPTRPYLLLTFPKEQLPGVDIVAGSRTYAGTTEIHKDQGEVWLTFEHLSLFEVGDLTKHVAEHPEEIAAQFAQKHISFTTYEVAAMDNTQGGRKLLDALQEAADANTGGDLEKLMEQWSEGTSQKVAVAGAMSLVRVHKVGEAPMPAPTLDTHSVDLLKKAVDRMANTGTGQQVRPANTKGPEIATFLANPNQPFIIGDNCLQFSFAPNVSKDGFFPAAKIRAHYDYFFGNSVVGKIRGEGETSSDASKFQRLNFAGELTTANRPGAGGLQLNFGAVGSYSYSVANTVTKATTDEWRAEGKAILQLPFLPLFKARPGANTKPRVEASFALANPMVKTRTADYLGLASFAYSLNANSRLALDLQAQKGWSTEAHFAGRRNFYYVLAQGRVNLTDKWDYVATYQCGRKAPDYKPACGWQTGIDLVTGR